MKKIVITGAAGFLGKNVVEVLLQKGYFIYAVVRPGSVHNSRIQEMDQLKKIEIDLRDIGQLSKCIHDACDTFLHLAWGGNERNGFSAQYQNVDYTLQALEVAKKLSCRRFICTGSQAEYGLQSGLTTEETLPNPNTSYGAAKLAALYLSRDRAKQLDIEWIWGRIFSVYGKYEPRGRMLPDLVAALQQKKSLQLTSATQSWDYLYSEDAAEALIALMEHGKTGEIYNIANGDVHPLRYFTELLRQEIAPQIELHYGIDQRQPMSLYPSVKKIQEDTGWQAKNLFIEGIRDTLFRNE